MAAAIALLAAAVTFPSCSGGGKKGPPGQGSPSGAALQRIEYGRLVDLYAFRRIDAGRPDRGDTNNREPVLIERDVVVNAAIETDPLFDTTGEVRVDANYRFLPFDVRVGHDELLILWDDSVPGEAERFADARVRAVQNLSEVPAAYRGQNSGQRPIPVVPRNAALRLVFDGDLGLASDFFLANPGALQLLEFKADPLTAPPQQAFRPVPYRVIPRGNVLVVDTTLIGGETGGGQSSVGLPPSIDQVTANLRLAIPVRGSVARNMRVVNDRVPELNGIDSQGLESVIRDFRAGNPADGRVGALADFVAPMVVGDVVMGITAVDTRDRVITLNKRFSKVAVRGRIPFTDGGLDANTGLPGGPPKTPTDQPLRGGDILYQEVLSPTGERVRIRAEVLMNLDVGNIVGDTNYPSLGLATDGTDGGEAAMLRVKVNTVSAFDAAGNRVQFEASDLPLGKDCTMRVHYYENVPYSSQFGNSVVSDSARRAEFLSIDPAPPLLDANRNPIPRGTKVAADAGLGLRFDEPMDLEVIEPYENLLLTNETLTATNIAQLIGEPKPVGLSVLAARLFDVDRDSTLLRLSPALGHYHERTKEEKYWFHVILGSRGAKDLAGNGLDLFDRRTNGVQTFSVEYKLDPAAEDNLVGFHTYRFAAVDEDGTNFGSVDFFGNFQIREGRLFAAPTQRFSGVADGQTLSTIFRDDKGECYFPGPPANQIGNKGKCPGPQPLGNLYQPSFADATAVNPQPPVVFQVINRFIFGGIIEPHNPRGSRLQMTYREDDFQLSYTDPSTHLVDIEALAWAPWNGDPPNYVLTFDQFDRYTLAFGHANKRPDVTWEVITPPMADPCCQYDCASLRSSLSTTFEQNFLAGSRPVEVVTDKAYVINPTNAFRSSTNTTFISYPRFERTYTWRDSRHVTWDMVNDRAIGLGGAVAATATPPNNDHTAHVSSPWVPENTNPPRTNWNGAIFVKDEGDFRGDRTKDHDPIALPLIVDFKVYPDDPTNGLATGYNQFHIGHVGPRWPGNIFGCGYYNVAPWQGGTCAGMDWPIFRVHSSGGIDGLNREVLIDIPRTEVATGGWIKDGLIGNPTDARVQVRPGDDHIHWAQADFVRKVSMVTSGFLDTRRPNQHDLAAATFPTWPGAANKPGLPDFVALGTARQAQYGIQELVALLDPPITAQPAGTTIKVEFRGAESFTNDDKVYDKLANDTLGTTAATRTQGRGNLLNPSYACEAYRYATANALAGNDAARIPATGLTPYVEQERLDAIRSNIHGTLPRFLNWRLVMENNTSVTPPVSPSLRSMSVVYRMRAR